MNVQDLVTQYLVYRRTLGGRFNTTENVLRSFCRAVGLQIPVSRIRSKLSPSEFWSHRLPN